MSRKENNTQESSGLGWGTVAVAGISVAVGAALGYALTSELQNQRTPCAPQAASSAATHNSSRSSLAASDTHSSSQRPCMDDDCAICLEKNEPIMRLNCGHRFHHRCASKWLDDQPTCPLCRRQQ